MDIISATPQIWPGRRSNRNIIIQKIIYWTTYQTYIAEGDLNSKGGLRQQPYRNYISYKLIILL